MSNSIMPGYNGGKYKRGNGLSGMSAPDSVALASGIIVVGAILFLASLSFVFKGHVNFY